MGNGQDDIKNVEATRQTLDLQQQMNENLRIAEEFRLEELRLLKEKQQLLGQSFEAAKAQLDADRTILKSYSDQLATLSNLKLTTEERLIAAKELERIEAESISQLKLRSQAAEKFKKIQQDLLAAQTGSEEERAAAARKAAVETEKLRAQISDTEKGAQKLNRGFDSFGKKLGIAADSSETMTGNFADMAVELSTGLKGDKLEVFFEGFADKAVTAVFSLVDNILKLIIGLDELSREFEKANGFGTQFRSTIKAVDENVVAAGLSFQDTTKALQAFTNNFSALDTENKKLNTYMVSSIGLLSHLGVSVEDSTKSIEMLSKGLKMSGKEANDTFIQITTSGQKASISNKKMASDFQANFSTLIQFGDQATEVFQKLAAESKATGVSMSRLVEIAKKFDTFEGAATQAQQLNAVLGVNLSTMDLMTADYADTIELIRSGMSGVNFSDLDRFEQNIIARGMGAKDAYEAQQILTEGADEYFAKLEAQAKSERELNKLVADNLPLFKRLAIALDKLTRVAAALLAPLGFMMDIFIDIDNATGQMLIPTLMALLMPFGLILRLAKFLGVALKDLRVLKFGEVLLKAADGLGKVRIAGVTLGAAFTLIGIAFQYVLDQLMPVWSGTKAFIEAVGLVLIGFLAFATGVGEIAIAIYAIGAAITYLVRNGRELYDLLQSKINPTFVGAFDFMAAGAFLFEGALSLLNRALISVSNGFRAALEFARPFVEILNKVGSYLGFDINTGEEAGQPSPPDVAAPATNATIAAAAAEIKTIVIAQLQETGIKETAEELKKIARIMSESNKDTNVRVLVDGRQISTIVKKDMMGG